MADIIEQLRDPNYTGHVGLMQNAAKEIELLRQQLNERINAKLYAEVYYKGLETENLRLKEEVARLKQGVAQSG